MQVWARAAAESGVNGNAKAARRHANLAFCPMRLSAQVTSEVWSRGRCTSTLERHDFDGIRSTRRTSKHLSTDAGDNMHEIITVQIGQQANFLGTHFWNAQVRAFPIHSSHAHTWALGDLLHLRW